MRLSSLENVNLSSRYWATLEITAEGTTIPCVLIQEDSRHAFLITNSDAWWMNGSRANYLDDVDYNTSFSLYEPPTTHNIDDWIRKRMREDKDAEVEDVCLTSSVISTKLANWLRNCGYMDDDDQCVHTEDCDSSPSSDSENEEFFHDGYERVEIYRDFHDYHRHQNEYLNRPTSPFKGHRIGVELEVEFDSSTSKERFCDKPSNWFYRERDGSLGNYGVEIITIPLLPKDAKDVRFWETLTSNLTHATSWDTGRCGLHVHIGREILGKSIDEQSETIGKLLLLYHEFVKDTRLNIKIYGREHAYHDHCGKTDFSTAVKHLGSAVLKDKDVKDRVKNSVISKSHETRYFDINLQNDHTIEFRKGKGSINTLRIAMVVEWSEILCKYAKMTPWQQLSYYDFCNFATAVAKTEALKSYISTYR